MAVPVGGSGKLVGLRARQVRPDGTVSVSVTVPVKPPTEVRVIVEVEDWPL